MTTEDFITALFCRVDNAVSPPLSRLRMLNS